MPATPDSLYYNARVSVGVPGGDSNYRLLFEFDTIGDSGQIWLWTKEDDPALMNNSSVASGGHRILPYEEYQLSDFGVTAYHTASIDFYIEVRSVTPDRTDKMEQIDLQGKPDDRITVKLLRVSGATPQVVTSDEVKYMVVNEDSFYTNLQAKSEFRTGIAAKGVYGAAPNTGASDLPQFAMESLSAQQLLTLGVPEATVELIGIGSGVPGFESTVYRDYVSGGYILTFAGTNDLVDWVDNVMQGQGFDSQQYSTAMNIGFAMSQVGSIVGTGLTITGHSLGGGLASAASVVSGVHADTWNAAGLARETLLDNGAEIYPGSLHLYDQGGVGLIDAYYLDWDILSYLQDNLTINGNDPMVSALGTRHPMDGPYDSIVAPGAAVAWLADWGLGDGAQYFFTGVYGYTMTQAHSNYLYGIMVTEGVLWGRTWDVFGYE